MSPGPTRTEGFEAAGEDFMKLMGPVIEKTPVGARFAEKEEIAYAVMMLCLPRASVREHRGVENFLFWPVS